MSSCTSNRRSISPSSSPGWMSDPANIECWTESAADAMAVHAGQINPATITARTNLLIGLLENGSAIRRLSKGRWEGRAEGNRPCITMQKCDNPSEFAIPARRDYVRLCPNPQFNDRCRWVGNARELKPEFSPPSCRKLAVSASRTPCRPAYSLQSRRKRDVIIS